MRLLVGLDWAKVGRDEAENGRDPNAVYDMPFCRFVALYFPPTQADMMALVNADRAADGLPPLNL